MPELRLVPPPAPKRSPLPALAAAAFGAFALATALYAIGVPAWSGATVGTFDVLQAPGTGGPTAHVVGPVHLDPAMNPVRVLAHVEHPGRARAAVVCAVALRDDAGRTVWAENRDLETYALGHSTRRASTTSIEVERFGVARAGAYTFTVDAGAVRDLRLEVRARTASVNGWVVGAGAALTLASLVVLLSSARRRGAA